MAEMLLPKIVTVRQDFPPGPKLNIASVVESELERAVPRLKPKAKIAVAVGSRGISNLQQIVTAAIHWLKGRGASPYIVPAMGSHGGATPKGQTALLAESGITKQSLQVPIRAAMDVECIGQTEEGPDVFCGKESLAAEGVIIINRGKPHTDFSGSIGSATLKLLLTGVGQRAG